MKKENGYVSGEGISQALGLSRNAIWKHVEQLREEGYVIEAVSRKGYRLVSAPDKLLPAEIKRGLRTHLFGKKIVHYQSVSSTMDEASRLGLQGEREGLVVCAETQIRGRGRLGRSWVSPLGQGVYFSLLLRPRVSLAQVSCLTLVSAVAVCRAIRSVAGVDAKIKWPNDILLGQKKVAGILTELNAELDRIHFVVLGVGINVALVKTPGLSYAASLDKESGQKVSRVLLLQETLREMETYYQLFHAQGFPPVARAWRELSATLGRQVKVAEVKKTIEGLAVDIDDQGALLVKEKNGSVVRKISGDVIHLRLR